MPAQIITTDDLYEFKEQLFRELKDLFTKAPEQSKKWLKSPEVRKLLGISSGTLQQLRISGALSFTKMGGILYYSQEDIEKALLSKKVEMEPPKQRAKKQKNASIA